MSVEPPGRLHPETPLREAHTYLFCVAQGDAPPDLAGAPAGPSGLGPLRTMAVSADVWLVVASAPAEAWTTEALEARFADLDWVSSCAVAHEAVIEHVSAQATAALPLKLFTLFRSDERAIEDARGREAEIARALERVAGCREWGLRVTFDEQRLAATRAAAGPRPSSGTAFLERKRRQRSTDRDARAQAQARAETVHEALVEVAREARVRARPAPEGTGPVLLDAVFLVEERQRSAFEGALEAAAAPVRGEGIELVLTGPWPAYHFVSEVER